MNRVQISTGQVFGRLTVIKRLEDYVFPSTGRKDSRWLCKCECGNEASVRGSSLKNGHTQSCDCLRKERYLKATLSDLTDMRFGRLKVLRQDKNHIYPSGKSRPTWLCRCDCGNELTVLAPQLKRGMTKSCGRCGYHQERMIEVHHIDIANQRFGKLVALRRVEDRFDRQGRRITQWLCRCDCGNETTVRLNLLNSGNTKSCGCLNESLIASELKKYCVEKYGAKKEYKALRTFNGIHWLPFDIYIPSKKIFIEVHGEQHYRVCNWHETSGRRDGITKEEAFEKLKQRDKIKKDFALQKGFYIEVDLRKIKTVDKAIAFIEDKIGRLV